MIYRDIDDDMPNVTTEGLFDWAAGLWQGAVDWFNSLFVPRNEYEALQQKLRQQEAQQRAAQQAVQTAASNMYMWIIIGVVAVVLIVLLMRK